MPVIGGLEWIFDTIATKYEMARPGYSDELYKKLFEYIPIDSSSKVVEIGIGAGQATVPILKTGCFLTAVEYGKNFSKLCIEKFKEYKNFSVINDKFENVFFPESQFDLVYSATAFHWIPENIGYSKVYNMLKPGGVFARFAIHPFPDKKNPALLAEIDQLYLKYYCEYYGKDTQFKKELQAIKEYSEEETMQKAKIAEKYGFVDINYAMFYRTRTLSAKEYIELLGTYSDHIAIEEKVRNEFFAKIEETINRYDGTFTIYDTIDLELARKP